MARTKTVENLTEKKVKETSSAVEAADKEVKVSKKRDTKTVGVAKIPSAAKATDKKPTAKKTVEKKTAKKPTKETVQKNATAEIIYPEASVESVNISARPLQSVLFVASECNPFLGSGGLADVIASLPKALANNGKYDVRVVMPLYGDISEKYRNEMRFLTNFNVPLAWRNQYCGVFSLKKDGVTFYFLDNEYYFKRSGLYGYYDDGERFAFFSKAVLETMANLDYYPEILHAHDWQTALSIIYLKTLYANRYGFDHIKTIFTIHNIEYQGKFGYECLGDLFGLPDYVKDVLDYDGCLNLMKAAIQLSERFSTVSGMYANEIKNPFFSHGLHYVVSQNEFKLCGILNGIDQTVYDPKTDEKTFKKFDADDISGKAVCKRELQKMLGLPERAEVPLIAIISRLVPAKGFDLVKRIFDELLAEDIQVVVLGTGEAEYENYFKQTADAYYCKCKTLIAYNKDLASKIYSAADIFLMPSKQEPCGLSQMIACRYGAVPIVRETGGLFDSIIPHNAGDRTGGNGFTFKNYNAHEMLYVIKDAIYTFGAKEEWNAVVKRAMTTDFSWNKSALEYEKLYAAVL